MPKCLHKIILCVLTVSVLIQSPCADKKLLADVTSNKLTRSHDGSWGLWSYHGTAHESHATKTSFIYNADLLTPDGSGHLSIASTLYPYLGLTSDLDPVYQEYLILQAKVAGIDGFLIEWGYMNHSSNQALQSYLDLVRSHGPFKIAVNWCDHWLMSELTNKTDEEVVQIFSTNLQYLLNTVYSSSSPGLYHKDSPVIFWFGGGLSSSQLRALQSQPLILPPGTSPPVWIGNYQNFASTPELWAEWGALLNGTFGWAPYVARPTPSNMSAWDYYGNTDDAVQYQVNVSSFGSSCVSAGRCAMWCGSVSPGFDNRGCAGWGRHLRFIPRHDLLNASRSTYDAQWQYYITKSSADYLIIPTLSDFPEATPILPLVNSSFESLFSTAKYASIWKDHSIDSKGVILPSQWYALYKDMQFYNQTPKLNVQAVNASLQAAKIAISQGTYRKAHYLLKEAIHLLDEYVKPSVKEENVTLVVPGASMAFSFPPVTVNDSFLISATTKLCLVMAEARASQLRENHFKGLLRFEYQSLTSSQHFLRVVSSSGAHTAATPTKYMFLSRGLLVKKPRGGRIYGVEGDRSEVCKLVIGGDTRGVWQTAVVALYKENQSWDHSAWHDSDLVFSTDGRFALRNISLQFTVFSKR